LEGLYSGTVDACVLARPLESVASQSNPDFPERATRLAVLDIDYDLMATSDMTSEPFNVYLNGVDSSSELADANIILSVNPKTKRILITSVPRDYKVPLYGDETKRDKLTHSGLYGTRCSIETLEALFDIKVDYYLSVNFDSLVNLVDRIGGVDVTSEFDFTSSYSRDRHVVYKFSKGQNALDGEATLAFVRERKKLPQGDRSRIKNQQAVIDAIIEKLLSGPQALSRAVSVVDAICEYATTNITIVQFKELAKMQLSDFARWDIEKTQVDGPDAREPVYTYPNSNLAVIIPDETSLQAARALMAELLGGVTESLGEAGGHYRP
jgi:LCP family protein required for cell wall assembly